MFKKLTALQAELRAPKNQHNKFGGYNYRSCEDILEAVKPLLVKYGLNLTISDDIVQIGERYYVRATATVRDIESDKSISTSALAREPFESKGMSEPQITGSASSYSRKYALNALFLIDDVKDADTNEAHNEKEARSAKPVRKNPDAPSVNEIITDKEKAVLKSMCEKAGVKPEEFFRDGLDNLQAKYYTKAVTTLQGLIDKKAGK